MYTTTMSDLISLPDYQSSALTGETKVQMSSFYDYSDVHTNSKYF